MARRYRYEGHRVVPRTGPRVVSIRELKWNARLGVVSQLVYIVGRLPRPVRYAVALAVLGVVWLAVELAVALWPELVALAVLVLLWRVGVPVLERRRQYRRDRAEALEVLGDDDGIPY